MPLATIQFKAGITRDDTVRRLRGAFTDGRNVRAVRGGMESVGGHERVTLDALTGVCRAVHAWPSNALVPQIAFGTHSKLLAYQGGSLADITPVGFVAGLVDGTGGAGYGTGTYGTGTYGGSTAGDYFPLTWSLANFGERLMAAPRNGVIYEWALNLASPATAVSGAPSQVGSIFVTPQRQLVAVGAHNGSAWDPMLLRWSDQEVYTTWTASSSNLAGRERMAVGNRLVKGMPIRGQNLIWSDLALYGMQFLGDPNLTFGFQQLGVGCGLIGPNAAAQVGGGVYWMAPGGQFWAFGGGAPTPIECPIRRDVFDNLSWVQADKIVAAGIASQNEVRWYYPDSRDGTEVSRYVALNVLTGEWSLGTTPRTAWQDAAAFPYPIAADAAGAIYFHEKGYTADGGALSSSLTTGPIEIGDGDTLPVILGIVPDFDDLQGGVDIYLDVRPYAQGPVTTLGPYTLNSATQRIDLRMTGRIVQFRFEAASAPSFWRLGAMQIDVAASRQRR